MKVNFILDGVDCAVCASKLERAINKLDYIKSASLNFVDLKLYIETIDDFTKSEQELENMLQSVTNKVLPNVILKNLKKQTYLNSLKAKSKNKNFSKNSISKNVTTHVHINSDQLDQVVLNENLENITASLQKTENTCNTNQLNQHKINWLGLNFIKVYLSIVLFIFGLSLNIGFWFKFAIYLLAYLVVGYNVIFSAFKNIIKGKFLDEKFLMSIASISAFCINEMPEAVAVMLFYQIGELFQDNAVKKSKSAISTIVNLKSEHANKIVDGNIVVVEPEQLQINDIILIKVGEKVPTDVEIIKNSSNFNTSSITGESLPKFVDVGSQINSGCINLTNPVFAKVISEYSNSTVAKILELIENNSSKKSKAENFISKFAKYYTPIVVLVAIILFAMFPLYSGGITSGIYRAAIFLVISCPCALVISIPLTYFCGLGISAKYGLLIKGANVLDNIYNLKAICFDKTGTITKGEFKITEVYAEKNQDEMLKLLVYAESTSNHPISKCIVGNNIVDPSIVTSSQEIAGKGIIATINKNTILCGNEVLLTEYNINFTPQQCVGTIIYVTKNNNYLGYVVVSDQIKESSEQAINNLHSNKIKTIMLTGDNKPSAEYVSYSVGITDCKANLLPHEKVDEFKKLESEHKFVGYVGDGINDAPVLNMASVGYAMGLNGSDSAIEYSDVVILSDNLNEVTTSIKIAKQTRKISIQNIVFCLAVKLAIMVLGIFNLAPMYLAIFADVGVSVLAILNAVRIFTIKFNKQNKKHLK